MKRKIVLIEWIDSMQTSGWCKKPESVNLQCRTAGFLVEKTAKHITVALNMSAYTDGDYMTIPAAAIKSVKVIGTVEQPKE